MLSFVWYVMGLEKNNEIINCKNQFYNYHSTVHPHQKNNKIKKHLHLYFTCQSVTPQISSLSLILSSLSHIISSPFVVLQSSILFQDLNSSPFSVWSTLSHLISSSFSVLQLINPRPHKSVRGGGLQVLGSHESLWSALCFFIYLFRFLFFFE